MANKDLELALRIRADLRNAQKQLDQFTKELDDTDKGARRASKGLNVMSSTAGKLRAVLGTIGGALALREIIQASDAYTSLNSRLLLVSDSQEEANATFKDAYQLAQETRQELGSTVELYARLARSTETLNLTDEERLAITRAINQSYVVSGASAQEAASSTLQLSQGLAAGALRGEARDWLEQLQMVLASLSVNFASTVRKVSSPLKLLVVPCCDPQMISIPNFRRCPERSARPCSSCEMTWW